VFLIWGEQNTEKKLGYVAEYCATCRDVRTVKLLRVGRTSHIYYLPLGQGRLLGYDGVCRKCELRFGVEITDYPALEEDKNAELIPLVQKTNPKLLAGNDEALSAWQRMNEVREPFVRYNQNLLQRFAGGNRYDGPAMLALAGSFVVPVCFAMLASMLALPKSADGWIGLTFIGLFFGGLYWTSRLTRSAPRRFFRARLEESLLTDLRALHPRRDELEACLAALREHEYPIAAAVSTDRVLACAASPDARPAPRPMPAPAPARTATLVISHAGKDYRFTPGVADIAIGRSRENAIVLGSRYVSRTHILISWPAGGTPHLKGLGRTGTSLRPDGASEATTIIGEVPLKGSGTIGLCETFQDAEARGDLVRYTVITDD
jgi:hypothetical protein